jgi:hypothetical protein
MLRLVPIGQRAPGTNETNRSIHRLRLSERFAASFGCHPTCSSSMNSIRRVVYSGPTDRPLPCLGTRSSRIARDLDCLAKFTSTVLGWARPSGLSGTRCILILRYRAIRSRSASTHASMARTATRKRICGDGSGSHCCTHGGGHGQSLSRSIRTTHGAKRAALLYPPRRCTSFCLPHLP